MIKIFTLILFTFFTTALLLYLKTRYSIIPISLDKESRIADCWNFADSTSFCLFENVCLRNQQLVFLMNNQDLNDQKKRNQFLQISKDNQTSLALPSNSLIRADFESSSAWKQSKRHQDCTSVIQFHYDDQNIYHWAIKLTPLFIYENFHQKSYCPKIKSIFLLNRKSKNVTDWQKNFLTISTGLGPKNVHFKLKKNQNDQSLDCFKYLFVPGAGSYLFTGQKEADLFRLKVKSLFKLKYTRSRVVFLKRKYTRKILNQKEVEDFLKTKIDESILDVVYFEEKSISEQIKIMSKAKFFIAVHGAALTNLMFMPKNSVVVEISPPHYKSDLYEKPAIQTGQHYFRLVTQAESSLHSSSQFFNISARDCISNKLCRYFWRDQNLLVNITKFSFLFEQVQEVL